MPADSLHTFATLSALHIGVLVAIVVATVVFGRYRRRLGDTPAGRLLDRQAAAVGLAVWVVVQAAEAMPWRFQLASSLPLHICDIVSLVVPLAIWPGGPRLARAVLYYWGLGLSTQAVFQPELAGGPATLEFWVFWVPHAAVVVLAGYDLIGRGFRPTWRDYFHVLGTLAVLVAVVLPVDLALSVNYGFVGRVEGGPLDFLGPWPNRVFKAATAVVVALALMTFPWTLARRFRRPRPVERAGQAEGAGAGTGAASSPDGAKAL